MTRVLFVGHDRGGVGKTFVTAGIAASLVRHAGEIRIVEYEAEPRLEQIIAPDMAVLHRPVEPLADGVALDPQMLADRWDEVLDDVAGGQPLLYDTAANILSSMLRHLRAGRLSASAESAEVADQIMGGGAEVGVVLVTTTELFSATAVPAMHSLVREALPKARIWVVENTRDGLFDEAPARYAAWRAGLSDLNTLFVRLPRLPAHARSRAFTSRRLDRLAGVSSEELRAAGMGNVLLALRERMMLSEFAVNALRAVEPIGLWLMGQDENESTAPTSAPDAKAGSPAADA